MKKILFAILISVIAVTGIITYFKQNKDDAVADIQAEIASKIVRFHIRANSDSDSDQQLKLRVKDRVVEMISQKLKDVNGLDDAKNVIYDNFDNIKLVAREEIAASGYDYDVDVYFERSYFPIKEYGDMTFPAGVYEAFRVDIGEAKGHNWWCVLYPSLCFIDSSYSVVPDDTKAIFKTMLSARAYDELTMNKLKKSDYEVRFKYLKFLN